MRIEVIKPFGPSIAKVEIPKNILDKLNNHIDILIKDKNNLKLNEFDIDSEFSKQSGWWNFLSQGITKWIEISTKKKITEFKSTSFKIIRQFENEYNPIHYHSGHISGAGFLKLPSSFGETFQEKEKNYNGKLTLVHGNRQFLSNSVYPVAPKVGDFYLFPHYLMRTSYPFDTNKEEKRSIHFNTMIDNNIFDVFS